MNCHTGNVKVIEEEGVTVFGGGTNRNGGWHVMAEVPDLAIGPRGVMKTAFVRDIIPEGWKCSTAFIGKRVPVLIEIDWPDFSIPSNLGKEFWLALIDDIRENGIKTVSTQCMGGHGRTGVQLAILMHYLTPEAKRTWSDTSELVMEVRKRMCEHCVESKEQQYYIAEVCEIPEGESVIVKRGFEDAWGDFEVTEADIAEAIKSQKPQKQDVILKGQKQREQQPKRASKRLRDKVVGEPKKHFDKSKKHFDKSIVRGWKAMLNLDDGVVQWVPERTKLPIEIWTRVDGDVDQFGDQFCAVTGLEFHPLAMHDLQTSKLGMAEIAELETNDDGKVKVKGRWYHPAFLEFDESNMEVRLASDTYEERFTHILNSSLGKGDTKEGHKTIKEEE